MTEYKAGQRVKVELEGVVCMILSDGRIRLRHQDEWFDTQDASVKVTLLDPAGWPPQVGDIWEADGIEWYIRTSRSVTSALTAVSDDGPDYVVDLGKLKARNPVLVRRRDQ